MIVKLELVGVELSHLISIQIALWSEFKFASPAINENFVT